MDRIIERKKWTPKRIVLLTGGLLLAVLIVAVARMERGAQRLNVERERLSIATVTRGPFQEFVPVNGAVLPLTTIYLDAVEGGRVEEKFVEDGAVVRKGQPVLRLSNTDLELSLVNQQTSVYNLITQMQIARNAAQQNTTGKLNQMTDVENALKEAKRVYDLNQTLFAQKAIGLQELKQSENAYHYQEARKRLTEQILQQDRASNGQQVAQAQQSFRGAAGALDVMKRKVGDLVVRAPVDGQLSSLDAEVGQNKNKGERLGQIDLLNGYKVRADIDEHYLPRVYQGLKAIGTLAGKDYRLSVVKIYTQVANSRFQVDLRFEGPVPEGIRRGQTLQLRLALSDETEALLLPRGGFAQQSGGNWVFRLAPDGRSAYRTDVQLGRQNPEYFEVQGGLRAGDKVIVSGYENYAAVNELTIKN